jgi:hypothetical protein
MDRRSFLTATLGATAATAVETSQAVAKMPCSPIELDLLTVCKRWFSGEYTEWCGAGASSLVYQHSHSRYQQARSRLV